MRGWRLEFRALGPLKVVDGRRELVVDGRIRRRLLSALLLHAGCHVSQDALERVAWGEDPPDTARRIVQSHLSRLRSLGLDVVRASGGYLLEVPADAVDAHRFRAIAEGARLRRTSSEQLREALGWWRGDPWADLPETYAVEELRRLIDCRAAVRERLALLELLDGRHRAAARTAEAAVGDDPRRELAWALGAVALYGESRRADALRVVHDARLAAGATGLDPAPVVRDVERSIIGEAPVDEIVTHLVRTLDDPSLPASVDGDGRRTRVAVLPSGLDGPTTLPFSGRHEELRALTSHWDTVAGGDFRMVLLAGEPGIGKSRIARELAVSLLQRGADVLHGTCDAELDSPFQPILEALRSAAGAEPDVGSLLAPFRADLLRVWPELLEGTLTPASVTTDPETQRFRTISALVGALGTLAGGSGLVLVLDDLHWCDAGTGQVLRRLARERPHRVLVVGTYRDTQRADRAAWYTTLPELLRHPVVERLPVSGLDAGAVHDLVAGAVGGPSAASRADDVADELLRLTEGNVLFIEGLLHQLGGDGRDARSLERLRGSLRELQVPRDVRELVERRVTSAHERAVDVLATAAVIGHRFGVEPLSTAVGDRRLTEEVLEASLAARLVSELAAGRFQFTHALVRAALVERLSMTRRASLHRTVVQLGAEDDPAACAVHWEAAAELEPELLSRAVDCSVAAGDRAMDLRSPDTAIGHYRRALELAARAPRPLEWELAVETKLGTAERQTGETGHRKRLLRIGRLALDEGLPEAAARAVLATYSGIPSRYLQADDDILGLLEAILARVDELAPPLAASVAALRSTEASFSPDGPRRQAAAAAALDAADDAAGPVVQGRALSSVLQMYFDEALWDRANVPAQLDRLCPELPPRERVVARVSLLQLHVSQGDLSRVPEWLTEIRVLSTELGEPELRCYVAMIEVQLALLTQGVAAARAALGEMAVLAGQTTSWMARMPEPFGWTVDLFAGGRFGALAEAYDAGIAARPHLPLLRATAAYALVRSDRRDRAHEHLDSLAAIDFDARNRSWGHVSMLVLCALTAAELRSDHRARLRQLLVGCRTVIPLQPMPHDTPAHAIGAIDASFGDHASAIEQYERAIAVWARTCAPMFQARSEAALAQSLTARAAPGDLDRARSLAGRVRTAASRGVLGDMPDLPGIH